MDYLKLACNNLNIASDKVVSHRVYEDHIVLVVDNGVSGCPKYTISLTDLSEPEETAEQLPDGEYIDLEPVIEIAATPGARKHAKMLGLDIMDVARSIGYDRVTVFSVKRYATEASK